MAEGSFKFAYILTNMLKSISAVKHKHGITASNPLAIRNYKHLIHLADKLVDISFPITKVTTLHVVLKLPCSPATSGIRKFEGPKEVGGLFEVRASSDDLMHEILDAKDVVFSKIFLDDSIVA